LPNDETAKTLVDGGADLNCLAEFPILDHFRRGFDFGAAGRSQRSTPLIVNVVRCNVKNVRLLIDIGGDVNLVDGIGMSPLMHAVKTNSMEVVQALLETDRVDVSAVDSKDWSVVDHCIALGDDVGKPVATFDNVKMLQTVLDAGAKPTASSLQLATKSGAVKIAEKLSKLLKTNEVNLFLTRSAP
jgi:ankyrin repeat protein